MGKRRKRDANSKSSRNVKLKLEEEQEKIAQILREVEVEIANERVQKKTRPRRIRPCAKKTIQATQTGPLKKPAATYTLDCVEGDEFEEVDPGDHLGKGAQGNVELLRRKRDGLLLACKVSQPQNIGELNNEAQVLQELTNVPGVVKFVQMKSSNEMVMEYCKYGSFYGKLPLDKSTAATVLFKVASTLQKIHARGIVHRDIKPANILWTETANGELDVRIADFGLAARLPRGLMLTGSWCGTRAYFAPEMYKKEPYDQGVDVWSLGIFAYEMVTGRIPYESYERLSQAAQDIKQWQPGDYNPLDTFDFTHAFDKNIVIEPEFIDLFHQMCNMEYMMRIKPEGICIHPWVQKHKRPEHNN